MAEHIDNFSPTKKDAFGLPSPLGVFSSIYGLGTMIHYDAGFAERLFKVLHLKTATAQGQDNTYKGKRAFIAPADVLRHLNGETTLAFSAVYKKKALFLGIDVDVRFPHRLPILRSVLDKMGVAQSAFCTNGSNPEKGKVIIALQNPMPQAQATEMLESILERCCLDEQFSGPDKIDLRPTNGEGGLLRIAGRNAAKNGPVEIIMDLDGNPTALNYLKPYKFKKLAVQIEAPKVAKWVKQLESTGFPQDTEFLRMLKSLVSVAHQFYNAHGYNAGFDRYRESLAQIRASTFWIEESAKRKAFDNPEYTYNHAVLQHRAKMNWQPLDFHLEYNHKSRLTKYNIVKISEPSPIEQMLQFKVNHRILGRCTQGVGRTYMAMRDYVVKKGLDRRGFALDQETIADLTGFTKRHTVRMIQDAVKQGLISIVESGRFIEGNRKKSSSTIYRLTSADEYQSVYVP